MKLHDSPDDFEAIVLRTAERENIRPDVIEKDYYVTLLLKELSENQHLWNAYFKGGTALYKALASINRFSEDIDLTVSVDGCSTNQKKTRLEKSAKGYKSLIRLKDDEENASNRESITSIYGYDPMFKDAVGTDALQRFGRVKVEATSFTVSEPVEELSIAPVIYLKATPEERAILEKFEVASFGLLTIKLERIFVDKVFATEFYYLRYKQNADEERRKFAFDVAKHIYDLIILHGNDKIKSLLSNPVELKSLIALKRSEENKRLGGVQSPIKDFTYLRELLSDEEFHSEYDKMQEIYVFNEADKVPLELAQDVIESIISIVE